MSVARWAWGLAATVMIAAAPASGQTSMVDGDYGNAAGCSFAIEGVSDGDEVQLLTPAAYETYGSYCTFAAVSPPTSMGHAVTAICANEGEVELTVSLMRIVKSSDRPDGFDIYDASGLQLGAVDRC